jgi:hypothetical protein
MQMLLQDLKANKSRDDIFQPRIRNQTLYKISNHSLVGVVTVPHQKLLSRVQHPNKVTFISTSELLLMLRHAIILFQSQLVKDGIQK